jgi:hypothetical protein
MVRVRDLAVVPEAGATTRGEQLAREMTAALALGPQVPVEQVPLRVGHFLAGGRPVTFVDVAGPEPTDIAAVAASLAAIERAAGPG